jgi:hypothetical protein
MKKHNGKDIIDGLLLKTEDIEDFISRENFKSAEVALRQMRMVVPSNFELIKKNYAELGSEIEDTAQLIIIAIDELIERVIKEELDLEDLLENILRNYLLALRRKL